MDQDDIPGVRGPPGGPGGRQGVPGESWLPLATKRVIKQLQIPAAAVGNATVVLL